eukprot:GEMP01003999.1.p1 GENE.GEMP01003999.1~~GEMP01003999.1.p1  ORF type:complete len:941 (+),score=172.03 GEMP01003999.1:22-2823(+)
MNPSASSSVKCLTLPLTPAHEVTREITAAGGWFLPSVISFLNYHRSHVRASHHLPSDYRRVNDDQLTNFADGSCEGCVEILDPQVDGKALSWDDSHAPWFERVVVIRHNWLFEFSGGKRRSGHDRCIGAIPLQDATLALESDEAEGVKAVVSIKCDSVDKTIYIRVPTLYAGNMWIHHLTMAAQLTSSSLYEIGQDWETLLHPSSSSKDDSTRQCKDILGKGQYSLVKKARRKALCITNATGPVNMGSAAQRPNGGFCALKIIKKEEYRKLLDAGNIPTSLLREISAQATVTMAWQERASRMPVLALWDVTEWKDILIMELELMTGGDLFNYVQQVGALPEDEASRVIAAVLQAISFCHRNHVAHRDIKMENIVYSKKGSDAIIRLGDFGMTGFVGPDGLLKRKCGTPGYVAPEILDIRQESYTAQVDMFSIGCVMYTILCGYEPFSSQTNCMQEILQKNLNVQYAMPNAEWDAISTDAKNLIQGLIRKEPTERYTADQALRHPWIRRCLNDKGGPLLAGPALARLSHSGQTNGVNSHPAKRARYLCDTASNIRFSGVELGERTESTNGSEQVVEDQGGEQTPSENCVSVSVSRRMSRTWNFRQQSKSFQLVELQALKLEDPDSNGDVLPAKFQVSESVARPQAVDESNFDASYFTRRGSLHILTGIPNQDRCFVMPCSILMRNGAKVEMLAGIFDGHGPLGHEMATFLAEEMPIALEEVLKSGAFQSVRDAIIFVYGRFSQQVPLLPSASSSGSTAVVGVLETVKESTTLTVAQCGDSEVKLFSRNQKRHGVTPVTSITPTHRFSNPTERFRIRNCMKGNFRMMDGYLVNKETGGRISVTRTFGDNDFMYSGLTSVPDIRVLDCQPTDVCVLLASDGFWDNMSNDFVADLVKGDGPLDTLSTCRELAGALDAPEDDATCLLISLIPETPCTE